MNSSQEHLNSAEGIGATEPHLNGVDNNETLLGKIRQQIEYYFSNENLPKDKFLKKLMDLDPNNQGYVPLEVICNFNKVKQLTTDLSTVRKALQNSKMVATSADGNSLRRSSPIPFVIETDSDKRTAYVSKIPKECDKETLRVIFSDFGKVMRVDLPLDKKSGEHKGIAFVEFSTEAEFHQAMRSTDKHKFALRPFKKSKKEDDTKSEPVHIEATNGEQKPKEDKKKKKNKKKKTTKKDTGELKGKETTGRTLDFATDSVYDGKSAWKHDRRLSLESNARTKLHQFNLPPFVPSRNPIGPAVDGSKGFTARRSRIIAN